MNSPPVSTFPKYRVFYRDAVNTGVWTAMEHVHAVQRTLPVASEVPRLTIKFYAGRVLQVGQTSFATHAPLDLGGKFIKFERLEDDGTTVKSTHCYQVQLDERTIGGKPDVDTPQPQFQTLTCVGLEDMLDRSPINGSYIYDPTAADPTTGKAVLTAMAFNERYRFGYNKTGNRSGTAVATGFTVFGSARNALYVFDAAPESDGEGGYTEPDRWSIDDILGYLYGFFVRSINLQFVWHEGSPPGHAANLRTALQGIYPPALAVEGMTVKQVFDTLLNPERGLGWYFRYPAIADNAPIVPIVDIFPVANTTISLDGVTLPANARTAALDTTTDNLTQPPRISRDHSLDFGDIVVFGEPVLTCFTASAADGTLDKGWTDDEQADYLATVNLPDNKQPDYDLYRNVFSKFVIPLDWEGFAGNGVGTVSGLKPVSPYIGNDGVPSDTIHSPLVRRGHGFESVLPIPREQQDESTPEIEYLESFALMRIPWQAGHRWAHGEHMRKLRRSDVRVSVSNNELAVYVSGGDPRELSGLPGWAYDWETDLMVTLAMRTDQRLYYRKVLSSSERRLAYYVRDAELWLVHQHAVIGVDDVGAPRYYSGAWAARDDAGRLKDIAETLAKWYGTPRQAWEVTYHAEWPDIVPGTYVSLTAVSGEAAIGNLITRIVEDYQTGQMTLIGQWKPLNPIF